MGLTHDYDQPEQFYVSHTEGIRWEFLGFGFFNMHTFCTGTYAIIIIVRIGVSVRMFYCCIFMVSIILYAHMKSTINYGME